MSKSPYHAQIRKAEIVGLTIPDFYRQLGIIQARDKKKKGMFTRARTVVKITEGQIQDAEKLANDSKAFVKELAGFVNKLEKNLDECSENKPIQKTEIEQALNEIRPVLEKIARVFATAKERAEHYKTDKFTNKKIRDWNEGSSPSVAKSKKDSLSITYEVQKRAHEVLKEHSDRHKQQTAKAREARSKRVGHLKMKRTD